MDVIESIKTDKAYNKYKLCVKKWEKEFKEKNLRLPSKLDIKEALPKVRYAYKRYFHLKSAALESSLSEFQLDDESFQESPDFFTLSDSVIDQSTENQDDTFNLDGFPSSHQLEQLLSSKSSPSSNTKITTWSEKDISIHVNHKSPEKRLTPKLKIVPKLLTDNLSKKLFQNSKFSIRNPRKSLSFRSNVSKSNDSIDEKLQNNENILIDESIERNVSFTTSNDHGNESVVVNMFNSINTSHKPTVLRQFNENWVERTTGITHDMNFLEKQRTSPEKFGLSNLSIDPCVSKTFNITENITAKTNDIVESTAVKKPNVTVETSDTTENSDDDDIVLARLQPNSKKRKLENSTPTVKTRHDNNVDVTATDITLSFEKTTFSDCEDKTIVKKRSRKKSTPKKTKNIAKKNKAKALSKVTKEDDASKPPAIEDFIPIGVEENIIPRFSKATLLSKNAFQAASYTNNDTAIAKKYLTPAEKLEAKIKGGTLNENFVRINIEKKVFVRGKKSINFQKYKKQEWKKKKALAGGMEFPAGGKIACFKCGELGHMARYCTAHRGDTLLSIEACKEDTMPTLQDMEKKQEDDTDLADLFKFDDFDNMEPTQYTSSSVPDSFIELLSQSASQPRVEDGTVPCVYSDVPAETPPEVEEALNMFGHDSFRSGQKQAIMRILSGKSTLLILSTGGGKSLCYQLPAYIYSQHNKCITLVISPLVSLMEDQVLSMPEFLKAGCLHTNQPETQRRKIMELLKNGDLSILLISPEALISGDRSKGLGSLFRNLPPIAFACIDEAHCVSQWSHNFRPSYLMICRVLRERLKVKCILGLTATASQPTIQSIIEHINVPDGMTGVITNPTLPDNLILSVSYEKDKDRALVNLIGSEKISSYDSIIVYCIRRDECERIAAILRASLQEPGKQIMEKRGKKRKRMSYLAEAYHAGMSAAQRKKIQSNFMDGTLRIIVATVAFGMGINKSDIRCIIHYNMPSSFESYVQEVGRAGRDGLAAHCQVFMSHNSIDKDELLKHIHSNTIDRHVIRKLLQKVFIPCDCSSKSQDSRCKGHEVAFPIEDTVEELDLASENIATLLCYLELHPKNYIKVLNNSYIRCKVFSYGGVEALVQIAKKSPPLAMAYTLETKRNKNFTKCNILEFPVIDVAAAIGWESGITKYHLKNLEWIMENGSTRRSPLKVEFDTLGFRIRAPGDLTPQELDGMLDDLHERVIIQEKTMLYQLEEINEAFSKFAKSVETPADTESEKSNKLKEVIRNYFERVNILPSNVVLPSRPLDEGRAINDIRALISSYRDCKFTGRAIARILQGIQSPNYPAIVWGRCKFWRSHIQEDFNGLTKLATQQIIDMRKD